MPRSARRTLRRFARGWWAGSAAGTATAPQPTLPDRGPRLSAVEPGKLVAEIASLGARSVFLSAEFPSLTPATLFLIAEFPFLTQEVNSRPAKPSSEWREGFSEPENPLADSRIRFSECRNPSAGSKRQFPVRKANSAARKTLRAPRKPLGALRKPNSAHVAPPPPDAAGHARVAFLVPSSTKRGSSGEIPVSRVGSAIVRSLCGVSGES